MKKILSFLIIILMLSWTASGQKKSKGIELKTAADSLSYSFGLLIGQNMKTQGVKDINPDLFVHGFSSGYNETEPLLNKEFANQYIQDYFNSLIADEAESNLNKSAAFLEENALKEGVITLPSGLQYKILVEGTGNSPKPEDQVRVHYTGTLIDGSVFDSSVERGEPAVFPVNQVIPGWTEALQLMSTGSKWMLYIPPALAYGVNGAGGVIGANEALIFEVELIEIIPQ